MSRRRARAVAAVAIAIAVSVAACSRPNRPPTATTGEAHRGLELVQDVGCIACHAIPRTRGPQGTAGPPLDDIAARAFIAGVLPNSYDNMVRWLLDPPSVNPDTGMPDLGLTDQQARDIAAYLSTLRR